VFPTRFFPDRYFAPRFWPKIGSSAVATTLGHLLRAIPRAAVRTLARARVRSLSRARVRTVRE